MISFSSVRGPFFRRVEAVVVRQSRQADRRHEGAQQAAARRADIHVAVGGGEAAHRDDSRVVVPRLAGYLPVDGPAGGLEVHHRDHRFQQ
jgi:hypothetical protein